MQHGSELAKGECADACAVANKAVRIVTGLPEVLLLALGASIVKETVVVLEPFALAVASASFKLTNLVLW